MSIKCLGCPHSSRMYKASSGASFFVWVYWVCSAGEFVRV